MIKKIRENKFIKLLLSIIFDLIGCVSYFLPGFAEATDILWAPFSAWIMIKMYKGTSGKVGAAITFIEEVVPFTDIIPTFTFMWIYTYLINPKKEDDKSVIDVS